MPYPGVILVFFTLKTCGINGILDLRALGRQEEVCRLGRGDKQRTFEQWPDNTGFSHIRHP